MALSVEKVNEICKEPDAETKDYYLQQIMYRIKDPAVSLKFYTDLLGMRLLMRCDFPEMKFTVYFLGYPDDKIPDELKSRADFTLNQRGLLELTHNYGTENEPGPVYHNGNSDPRGFGHIGIVVPDVYAACERLEKLGAKFIKKPDGGKMKGIAFVEDPDGYWIEIISKSDTKKLMVKE